MTRKVLLMPQMLARPTVYNGVSMRSRMEAGFAQWLDSEPGIEWEYEPHAYASERGQYLPDFLVRGLPVVGLWLDVVLITEVKPPTFTDFDSLLERMMIVGESEGNRAMLLLVVKSPDPGEPSLPFIAFPYGPTSRHGWMECQWVHDAAYDRPKVDARTALAPSAWGPWPHGYWEG